MRPASATQPDFPTRIPRSQGGLRKRGRGGGRKTGKGRSGRRAERRGGGEAWGRRAHHWSSSLKASPSKTNSCGGPLRPSGDSTGTSMPSMPPPGWAAGRLGGRGGAGRWPRGRRARGRSARPAKFWRGGRPPSPRCPGARRPGACRAGRVPSKGCSGRAGWRGAGARRWQEGRPDTDSPRGRPWGAIAAGRSRTARGGPARFMFLKGGGRPGRGRELPHAGCRCDGIVGDPASVWGKNPPLQKQESARVEHPRFPDHYFADGRGIGGPVSRTHPSLSGVLGLGAVGFQGLAPSSVGFRGSGSSNFMCFSS